MIDLTNIKIIRKEKVKRMRRKPGVLKSWKQFLKEEDGMGTVEVILIIVEIFTLRKQGILC